MGYTGGGGFSNIYILQAVDVILDVCGGCLLDRGAGRLGFDDRQVLVSGIGWQSMGRS